MYFVLVSERPWLFEIQTSFISCKVKYDKQEQERKEEEFVPILHMKNIHSDSVFLRQ